MDEGEKRDAIGLHSKAHFSPVMLGNNVNIS